MKTEKPSIQTVDDIKVKASAPTRGHRVLTESKPQKPKVNQHESMILEESDLVESEQQIGSSDDDSEDDDERINHSDDNAVFNALEKGWEEHLRETIATLEPDYGQDIFDAYIKEKENYQGQLDAMIKKNQNNQDLDQLVEDLEISHEDRVKEIFGVHYDEIKDAQKKLMERLPALESVQTQ
jgi:hypothetical protein